ARPAAAGSPADRVGGAGPATPHRPRATPTTSRAVATIASFRMLLSPCRRTPRIGCRARGPAPSPTPAVRDFPAPPAGGQRQGGGLTELRTSACTSPPSRGRMHMHCKYTAGGTASELRRLFGRRPCRREFD